MPPVKRKRDAPEQPKGEPKDDGTTSSVDPKTDTSYAAAGRGPFPLSASAGLTSVCDILRTRKNIVVLAGAGISVSSGIPDFRSKTGLYETLDTASLGLSCAEDLFDLEQFLHDPRPFYRFARNLYPSKDGKSGPKPTPAHRFLALLSERGMLRRVYTQNIDGLEERARVPSANIVQTHGSLRHASCLKCKRRVDSDDIMEDVWAGRVPKCRREKASAKKKREKAEEQASTANEARAVSAAAAIPESLPPPPPKRQRRPTRKASERSFGYADSGVMDNDNNVNVDDPTLCGGVLKPNITFFGETLSNGVARRLEKDRDKADCIIVMGTSLSVAPMSSLTQYLSPSIPRFLINRNVVKAANQRIRDTTADEEGGGEKSVEEEKDTRDGYVFDACLLGFCDDVSRALVKELNCGAKEKSNKESERGDACYSDGETPRMLCNVEEEYRGADGNVHGLHRHPSDRVLLFPGAVISKQGKTNGGGNSDSESSYCREVARCDGCGKEIKGEGVIMKCQDCFDFDLCRKCYESKKIAESHFDGKHTFVQE